MDNTDYLDFDPGAGLSTPVTGTLEQPIDPAFLDEDHEVRAAIYELHVRGYPPSAIASKLASQFNLKSSAVRCIIDAERKCRLAERESTGAGVIHDAIAYYQAMKVAADERAKYADDKFAPEFLKISLEAQNRIDKLWGLDGTKGQALPGDGDLAGLGMYKVSSRVIREDAPALEAGEAE